MKQKIALACASLVTLMTILNFGVPWRPNIPKAWDVDKIKSAHLPFADSSVKVSPVSADYYYRMPERVAYKTYPMYMPGREPKGYLEWLRQQDPKIIFDPATLKTEAEWIKAGEIIYDLPQNFLPIDSAFLKELPAIAAAWKKIGVPVTSEGIIPFMTIAVREKGKIELADFSCGMCHDKLMQDGKLLKGGQGNFPFNQNFHSVFNAAFADYLYSGADLKAMPDSLVAVKDFLFRLLFAAPWVKHESQQRLKDIDIETTIKDFGAVPKGALNRHGSNLGYPTSIPDLFNLKTRKYFDHTGLIQQRDIGDLMRYATLNQEADFLNDYNGFTALDRAKEPEKGGMTRFTDEQLYALAKFIYSLKSPKNPVVYPKSLLAKGQQVFIREGCVTCHTPPLYSNNKLTPVDGFEPPPAHFKKYNIFNVSVETDPGLALYTRRGTGYYKVPSLIGVWNRTAFLHSGYLANLEDMFDPERLQPDYVPTGYKPAWLPTMAVKGHEFGMELTPEDKKALLAFIKSL